MRRRLCLICIVEDATPEEDEAALARLALWCTRYSPLVTPCQPDGIFIDIAGSSHLFKGEAALLDDMRSPACNSPASRRAAIADTPGCAWAVSRFGTVRIVPPGTRRRCTGQPAGSGAALASEREMIGLREWDRAHRAARSKPRASLQTRFGSDVLLRLDQALGAAAEVLVPAHPAARCRA